MLDTVKVKEYLNEIQQFKFENSDHYENPAALPDASLDFLLKLCNELNIKNIFEFGSGRSTKAFLGKKYNVTSLEDTNYWLENTLSKLDADEKKYHTSYVLPLQTNFLGLFPVLDWNLNNDTLTKIKNADLILVDSPYYTPFRESTLWKSLKYSNNAIIILDDTRIPTLRKFCDRLASSNDSLIHSRIEVGHTFDIFFKTSIKQLKLNHNISDIIKGWFRYFQGRIFYKKL